ncbi:MAG: hypothetical protein ACI8WB_004311 [Phenylobacterium sp.]|jgi:hypothetical protein
MSASLQTNFNSIEMATKDNALIEAITARALNAYVSSIPTLSTADLIALNTLPDTEFSIEIGQKMAEASVFINADSHAQENLRVQAKNDFLTSLTQHGGGYSSKELAIKLGITTAAISKRRKEHQLFHLQVAGKLYHPTFQFNDQNKVTDPFKRVIAILNEKDQMAAFAFLTKMHINRSDTAQPIYEILRGSKQPRYIYEQIEEKAARIDAL